MEFVVDKLIEFSAGKDEELRDISGLGMCFFVLAFGWCLQHICSVEDYHIGAPSRREDRDKGVREANPQASRSGGKCTTSPISPCTLR